MSMSSRSNRLPDARDLHPDIVVNYLQRLGVTPETTRAIRDEVEKKRADNAQLEKKRAAMLAAEAQDKGGGGGKGGEDGKLEDVKAFGRRQGTEGAGGIRDGDNVMAWGILEGNPEKVEQAYRGLSEFVTASWELYRPELEAVTFPIFVHCYLTLVMFDDQPGGIGRGGGGRGPSADWRGMAKSLMRAWGGEHEARYKEEMALLKMVTTKEHAEASSYCQLVLNHKFRVKMCLATSKLLNAFLVNMGLLLIMHILNTRVRFILEERSPMPFVQVVRCGPSDAFPAALHSAASAVDEEASAAPDGASKGGESGSAGVEGGGVGGGEEKELKWGAAPPMEVALLKQTERDAVASGLYYPLSLEPKTTKGGGKDSAFAATSAPVTPAGGAASAAPGTPTSKAPTGPAGTNGNATATSPPNSGGGGLTVNTGAEGSASGASGSTTAAAASAGTTTPGAIPTGSAAAAAARARASRVAAASVVTEATARRYGGMRQKQVSFPLKPPPLPDPGGNWPYLRLTLRPLDSNLLEDTLSTPEGGARPFLANSLSPHVVMMTFYNALDTLCCLKPTRDGMQVAAGFTDRMVRTWRTAPNAPHPPTADGISDIRSPASSNGAKAGEAGSGSGMAAAGGGEEEEGSGDTLRFVGHSQPVYGISWSPDGRFLLSSGGDGAVRLWDMARGMAGNSAGYVRYDGHCGPVWDVTFGPAGYYFATAAADRTACLWSTDCASPLRIFAGHLKGVLCVTFHPNANYVVTGSMDKTVRVWDVQTGNCVRLLAGHSGSVTCVAVSPNGRRVAAGSSDRNIRVWDIATGKALALFKGHKDDVESIDFSAEGSALVSGSRDNTVKIWDVASACSRERDSRDGVDSSASLAEQIEAAAAAAAGVGHGSRGGGSLVTGTKRKKGAEGDSGVAGAVWSMRGDGPSHGPVHSFGTRSTGVYSVLFTKRNLVIAAGVCRSKT